MHDIKASIGWFESEYWSLGMPTDFGLLALMGCPDCPLTYCWRTAPTAESDASVIRLVRALGVGCTNSVAAARASLMAEKAAGRII